MIRGRSTTNCNWCLGSRWERWNIPIGEPVGNPFPPLHGNLDLQVFGQSSPFSLLSLRSSRSAPKHIKQKSPNRFAIGLFCFIGCLAVSYSHMGSPTLPSALTRFTSEFEMGSGGTTLPLPPSKFCSMSTSGQYVETARSNYRPMSEKLCRYRHSDNYLFLMSLNTRLFNLVWVNIPNLVI